MFFEQRFFSIFAVPNFIAMAAKNNKRKSIKKRRKPKFKTISFKLSENQYRSLTNYCSARKTTPIKLIKKNIERFTKGYVKEVPVQYYVTENQLNLFQEE